MDEHLRELIRYVRRTFYDLPKSLVLEYIFYHDCIRQQDRADCLSLDPKTVRSYIQAFKRDKFIIEDHRLESNDGMNSRQNQDQYYYRFNIPTFINIVKYRLIHMQTYVENLERQQTTKPSNYKCEQCRKDYTKFDIGKLSFRQDAWICSSCGDNVQEDIEAKETSTIGQQSVDMRLFNEQMNSLFCKLKEIVELKAKEQ